MKALLKKDQKKTEQTEKMIALETWAKKDGWKVVVIEGEEHGIALLRTFRKLDLTVTLRKKAFRPSDPGRKTDYMNILVGMLPDYSERFEATFRYSDLLEDRAGLLLLIDAYRELTGETGLITEGMTYGTVG